MKKYLISSFLLILVAAALNAQVSISADGSSPDPSAGLEVKSTGKGFLPPRMTSAAMYAIQNPADGLVVFCTDCGGGSGGHMMIYRGSAWRKFKSGCLAPRKPAAGTNTVTYNSVTWQWQASAGATGYRWSTTPFYSNSISLGTSTTYAETGLNCTWSYTRYVWAENGCGRSDSLVMTGTLPACPWSCGQNITDPRDNTEYGTVLIGTQCWLRQNLNIGTRINGIQNQTNNNTIEKYCYNDLTGNCSTYGGMYRWGEMVQYINGASDSSTWLPAPTGNIQGICMPGWHLPSESEWNTLVEYLGGTTVAGGKMKESSQSYWASPNSGATNESGFTALPGGYRHPNGSFFNYNVEGNIWSVTQGSATGGGFFLTAGKLSLFYSSPGTGIAQFTKRYGIYVRCLKDY